MKRRGKWIVLAVVVFVLIIAIYLGFSNRLPAGSVLVLDLSGSIEEEKASGAWGAALGGDITVLHQLLDAIDTAKSDPKIAGLVVKVADPGARWAKLQEIRDHLLEFRKSGKPSVAYLSSDFSFNRDFFLATGCEQVWISPSSPLTITGLMAESHFYRGTFEKLKIVPDYVRVAEYKTAVDQYTEKKYTATNREMSEWLMRSTYDQYASGLAQGRKMDLDRARSLLEKGPFLAEEGMQNKLVDRLAYWDEVQSYFRQKTGEWRPVELSRYARQIKNLGMDKIAIVHATGVIIVGHSDWTPFAGFLAGSTTVAADLRRAREDSSVKAIILRVDSPGGSVVASDIIRREVQLAAKEKPLVVSMSDLAASGGYYISMPANKIIAEPGTLTGSIGVYVGKFNIEGFYELLGISSDHLQTSDNASLFWERQAFTPAQRAAVVKMVNQVYADFTRGVAEGRHMKQEDVDKVGRGRVWTGLQGKENGLVDEIGGLSRAVSVAKALAKMDPQARVQLVHYPREKGFLESLLSSNDERQGLSAASIAAALKSTAARMSNPIQVRMSFDLDIR